MALKVSPTGTHEWREFASEIKFLVPGDRIPRIEDWARTHLDPDPHGGGPDHDTYGISSLYFDTRDLDVFHGRGSYGRSKYRARRYNGSEIVHLERKTKTRTWVSKRRSPVPLPALAQLESGTPDRSWPGFWFHRRLLVRQMLPVCQISYVRTARIGEAEGHPVRMTLDRELTAAARTIPSFDANLPAVALLDGLWIMELKYRFALPALFKRFLTEFSPVPDRISKYRIAVAALGLAASASVQPPPAAALERADA